MRIAIIDHVSAGGVSRFAANLVSGLAEMGDVESVTYFVSNANIVRDELEERWQDAPKVELVGIEGGMDALWAWEKTIAHKAAKGMAALLAGMPRIYWPARRAYRAMLSLLGGTPVGKPWYYYRLPDDVLARLDDFDVVYLAWPYFIEPFETSAPVVATFHDFHFEHFPHFYEPDQLALARRQTTLWLDTVEVAVTSTEFISSEIDEFFDAHPKRRAVIYLAPYTSAPPHADVDTEVLARFGVERPYIIYSGGTTAHKNVAGIFAALELIDPEERPLFVITGIGTDRIGTAGITSSAATDEIGQVIQRAGFKRGDDYLPLGYVSEHDVDELTRAAALVISASKYEAGCGPALDAWSLGAPVAFSSIPPFIEQADRFGVHAYRFDPFDVEDISRAILSAIRDPDGSRELAIRSQEAMLRYTWSDVARYYFETFRTAAAGADDGRDMSGDDGAAQNG